MLKKLMFSVLVFICVAFTIPTVLAAGDRSADREEINQLMWRYARALDTLNADAYVAVFTEDGAFGSGELASKGHKDLRAMIDGVAEGRKKREAEGEPAAGQMFHMTTDSWIEFIDDTHARHHSYWVTVFGAAKQGDSPNVAAVGRGIDDVVKVDGKWLIKLRNVAPDNE